MIDIFIGYDHRERAATNVLIDSIYNNSTVPLRITPLLTPQLINAKLFWRERDSKQSTDFSFTRFLVPYLMNYEGWAIFMDCDMLCNGDISEIWEQRDSKYALHCVKHQHNPTENKKFQGEVQTNYPKKNWSSFMMLNCTKCRNLTLDYVNQASGLDLHRFNWLSGDHEIKEISGSWNFLVGVQPFAKDDCFTEKPKLLHWTLGGPWFCNQRTLGDGFAADWFVARHDAMKLWD